VEAAIDAARRSFDEAEWRRMPGARRAEVLEAAAAAIRADATRLATLEALETGKAIGGALTNDVYEAANAFSYAAALARTLHGLITERHADRVRGFVDRALQAGDATLVGDPKLPSGLQPSFVVPTVLGGVRPGSEIEQQEVFGPVLAALPFSSEDEAVALANGTQYGLNGTVFTQNLERAFRMAGRLDCGEVNVNCHFAPDMNGGRVEPRKASGHSRTGIDAYLRTKAVNIRL
jgi:acyl-CoA reductase-like NAD-dependent aldehyde dehydrogenase